MRISQLVTAALAATAVITLATPAAAEPWYCVYVHQQRVAHMTIRSMEVCVL